LGIQAFFVDKLIWDLSLSGAIVMSLLCLWQNGHSRLRLKPSVRKAVSYYLLGLIFWSISAFAISNSNVKAVVYVSSLAFVVLSVGVMLLFLKLVFSCLDIRAAMHLAELRVVFAAGAIFAIAAGAFSSLFITDVVASHDFAFFPVAGPLLPAWVVFLVYLAVSSHWKLYSGHRSLAGKAGRKLGFFLFWSVPAYLLCASYILPVFGLFVFPYPLGVNARFEYFHLRKLQTGRQENLIRLQLLLNRQHGFSKKISGQKLICLLLQKKQA